MCVYVCICAGVCVCMSMCMCVCTLCLHVCVCMYVLMSMRICWAKTCTHTGYACGSQRSTSHVVLTLFERGCHFIGRCMCQGKWPTSSQRFLGVCFPSPLRSSGITAVCYHSRLYVVSGELNSCPHTYAAAFFPLRLLLNLISSLSRSTASLIVEILWLRSVWSWWMFSL